MTENIRQEAEPPHLGGGTVRRMVGPVTTEIDLDGWFDSVGVCEECWAGADRCQCISCSCDDALPEF